MKEKKSDKSRRKLLKSIAVGSGAIVTGKSLPESWSRPVVDSVIIPAHAQTSAPTEPIPLEDNFSPGYPRVTEDSGVTPGTTCSTWSGKFSGEIGIDFYIDLKYCGGTNWSVDASIKAVLLGIPSATVSITLSALHPKLCPIDLNLYLVKTKLCLERKIEGGDSCVVISGNGWVWDFSTWKGGNFDLPLVCFPV